MKLWKRVVTVVCILGMGLSLTGCNTLHGVGEDVEQGGEAVQDAVD